MLVCKDLSVRREGLADGVAAAMDRPRSDPFTANPSVFLCTEYAPRWRRVLSRTSGTVLNMERLKTVSFVALKLVSAGRI